MNCKHAEGERHFWRWPEPGCGPGYVYNPLSPVCERCGIRLGDALARSQEREKVLREALKECADALEEEVRGAHGVAEDSKLEEMHPVSVRRFNRDMNAVWDARRTLASSGGGE